MKKRFFNNLWVAVAAMCLVCCTQNIDEQARYVFQYESIASYLQKHEEYSEYCSLLKVVPLSEVSTTTVMQLMGARGHFTVFAPTNDVLHNFLDTLASKEDFLTAPSWDAFTDSGKRDSIRKVIVLNSIIDSGDDDITFETWNLPTMQNSEILTSNMYNRKLTVHYNSTDSADVLINNCAINVKNRNILAVNGVIHSMDAVVAPSNNTLGDYYTDVLNKRKEGFHVMAMLTEAVGMIDTLSAVMDYEYERIYLNHEFKAVAESSSYPEHRYYGFTCFAETDSMWSAALGKDALDITVDDVVDYLVSRNVYPDAVRDRNYTSEDNLLHRFVSYHYLPVRLATDRLVMHGNERGYSPAMKQPTVAMSEFRTTMGHRRLMKLYESAESNGIYINRFPNLDNARRGTYHELSCDPDKEGIRIGTTEMSVEGIVRNAMLYPIDKFLLYDEETRHNLGTQRIRIDIAALFPELTNNDYRLVKEGYFPTQSEYKYFNDLTIGDDGNYFYAAAVGKNWPVYYGDELYAWKIYDITYRLPPVPRAGIYELRFHVSATDPNRGIAQVYWGDNLDKLAPTGIPLDMQLGGELRITPVATTPSYLGWEPDTEDDDYNIEVEKKLRQQGFMKAPALFGCGGTQVTRYAPSQLRRIMVREYMDPDKTYYLRFKSCLDYNDRVLLQDYLEFCPKEIYDSPTEPEDIW